jgi:hypothetical protein
MWVVVMIIIIVMIVYKINEKTKKAEAQKNKDEELKKNRIIDAIQKRDADYIEYIKNKYAETNLIQFLESKINSYGQNVEKEATYYETMSIDEILLTKEKLYFLYKVDEKNQEKWSKLFDFLNTHYLTMKSKNLSI